MPVDFGKAPIGPAPTPFKGRVSQLPPGHPARTKAIDRLVSRSFTATPKEGARIAKALKAMNPSPDEVGYISHSSAARGDAAIRAKGEGVHGLVHHALPALANIPLALIGTDTKHVAYAARHPIARLQDKGPFKPTQTVDGHTVVGGAVPFVGGSGALRGAGKAARVVEHKPRTVKLGKVETQFPLSPSHGTAWTQRHLDRLSERLVDPATKLSESDSPVARAAGKAVTKASARARVPIQAGKNLRQEARRAQSLRAEEVKALTPSLLHADEGSQLAHFWWAQMPADLHNAKGLALVRDKLALERASLSDRVAGLSGRTPGVRNTPRLRRAVEDLRSADANLAKLDKVVAKPPELHPHVIESARTLMHDREQALIAAGKLDQVGADARTGLVARWLGVQPTGQEVYVGHRLAEQRGGIMPGGGGLGGTRLPAGVGKENKMILASTGRVRQSMQTVTEDWQRAQAYKFTTTAKDELARMGEPIGPEGPKPGHLVVNPAGHTLPRTWKLDEHARAAAEGLNPEDVMLHDLEEYARNTLAAGADRQRLIAAAAQAGHHADLRQIPEDVARRYFAQFVPHRVVAGTVPGVVKGASAGRQVADLAHDLVYASLIYSNPGYIPANTVANLVMAGLHQGAFLPVNLIRAGQAYFGAGRKLRALLTGEVGMGATRSAASEGRYPGSKVMDAAISKVAGIPDNMPRISAFLHEAAREGVISKTSPILTKQDQRALVDLLTNPKHRPLLNDIRDRANQAMVDFERLGAHEKAVAKRLFFVWAWTRGATRYPARFALDHPLRSIALGYAAAGAPGAPGDVQAKLKEFMPTVAQGMPPWLHEALSAGNETIKGHTYPAVLPTSSISPVSTPLQVGRTIKDVVDGSPGQSASTLGDYLNPALVSGYHVATKTGTFGQHESYGQALKDQALRLAPGANLIRGELHPKAGGIYPGDATRLGRLKRALRVFPVAIDPEQAFKARVRAGIVPHSDQLIHRDRAFRVELTQALKKYAGATGLAPELKQALDLRLHRNQTLAAATEQLGHGASALEKAQAKYEAEVHLLVEMKALTPEQAKGTIAWAKTAKARDINSVRGQFTRHYFNGKILSETIRYLNQHGADLSSP